LKKRIDYTNFGTIENLKKEKKMRELIIGDVVVGDGVTLDTAQTITGSKTFEGTQTFNGRLVMPGGTEAIRVPGWRGTDGRDDHIGVHQNGRFRFGNHSARGVNMGSLLVSNAWSDQDLVPDRGIFVRGDAVVAGDMRVNGVSQSTGRVVGLHNIVLHGTRDQNLRGVFERLNNFQTIGVTGIGANWGNNLTTFLGDPGIGVYATCQARRMSFSNQYQGHSIFSGIIEFVVSDAWGTVRRGWLYSINPNGSIIWSGWRNV